MGYITRTLLGSSDKKIVHDPGAKGPSGEGEAAITMLCLTYFATVGILIYEKFYKVKKEEDVIDVKAYHADMAAKAAADGKTVEKEMTTEEIRDKIAQERWTQPEGQNDPKTIAIKLLLVLFVLFNIWVFLLVLSIMGTGFNLLGGKSSAKMFDVVDNPISGVMIGILATVLFQSSSTTTSIVIALVGADELSVNNGIFMIMGSNIGTSVTNNIVAMGHVNNQDDLRRGFAAASVHDLFNLLTVAVFLPLNWIYPFLEKMTYEMAKGQKPCDDGCVSQEFIKPYITPYDKGVADVDKKVADYITKGFCAGECGENYNKEQMKMIEEVVCKTANGPDCRGIHRDFDARAWFAPGYLDKKRAPGYITIGPDGYLAPNGYSFTKPAVATDIVKMFNDTSKTLSAGVTIPLLPDTTYEVCGSRVKTGLCEKRLLKGGIALDEWKLSDEGAGTLLTILSLAGLCSCLFCIVYTLQIIVKGTAARILQKVVGFNGYLNILIGCGITILVQSSSITTATLTPIAAVGLITLEDMLPLTLGANIGTTITGIMGASVVKNNPVAAWQVALTHLFFNIFGILMWYPIPRVRQIPLNGARWLGHMTMHPKFGKLVPLVYTLTVFFIIPAIVYGIAVAATA